MVDARAGAFPPYYVPDAFLFSPTYGMIPKDAAGDATAARTAKFTWYEHQARPRAAYVKEQRRLFAQALGRADVSRRRSRPAAGRPAASRRPSWPTSCGCCWRLTPNAASHRTLTRAGGGPR